MINTVNYRMPLVAWVTSFSILSWLNTCYGQSTTKQIIEIPVPIGARLDSQEPRSLDFVASGSKGHAVVVAWLAQFKAAGWKVTVVDEELPDDGEYELTKNGVKIEIEFDDPTFVPADIELSCGSNYVLQLAGAQVSKAASAQPQKTSDSTTAKGAASTVPTREFEFEGRRFKETRLGPVADVNFNLDEGQQPTWWSSPNGKRFAFVVGPNVAINVDGEQHDFSPLDESFAFSPDSQHFAVASSSNNRLSIMIDGKVVTDQKTSLKELNTPLVFSPDSQHVACIATDNHDAHHLLIDGVSRANWQHMIFEVAFTSNSQCVLCAHLVDSQFMMYQQPVAAMQMGQDLGHACAYTESVFFRRKSQVGYIAKFSEQEMGVMYEGKEQGDRLIEIKRENVCITEDGSKVLYMGDSSPIRNTVVANGKRGQEHNPFEDGRVVDQSLVANRTGTRWAYVLAKDETQRVVIDGKPGPEFQETTSLEFSADGNHFSYLALKDGSPLLVIDGVEGKKHALVSLPNFSSDGKTYAYYAELGGKQFCVVNGQKHSEHDGVSDLTVSSDGSTVSYVATNGTEDRVVINQQAGPKFDLAMILGFCPGSNRLIYLGQNSGKENLVDGAKVSKQYDFVRGPGCFSKDGKHFAVTAILGEKYRVLVDGREDPAYDDIVYLSDRTITFDGTKYLYYAVRENVLYRLEGTF